METIDETAIINQAPLPNQGIPEHESFTPSTDDCRRDTLEHTLATAGCLPKREFKDAAEFAEYLKNEETLIFDGTEQRTQRPSEDEAQKDNYSGKKSATRPKP